MAKGRQINGKYHVEDGDVVNSRTGEVIPEDEPLFLFRAKDILAAQVLAYYEGLCRGECCTDEQIAGVLQAYRSFCRFPDVKLPD